MRSWLTRAVVFALAIGVACVTSNASALSSETASSCSTQEMLRTKAERTCESRHALITKVHFVDLCGANGSEPMYMTVTFDCHPKQR